MLFSFALICYLSVKGFEMKLQEEVFRDLLTRVLYFGLSCCAAELTQDIVSKGLGIVYEKCNAEQKQELVGELVETLTTGKRSVTAVGFKNILVNIR